MGLVLLTIIAGCLGTAAPGSNAGDIEGVDGSMPSIAVSASGSVSVEPDLAVIHLAVETTADSADEARGQVATDVVAVRQALADLGLPDDAVTTVSFQIHPEYDYTRESRELVGYRAVHALSVNADVDQAGAVVDAAVGAGAVRVNGVQFTLADETRQSAREQALRMAMANAAADAGAIADAADLTLEGVHAASTGGPVVVPFEGRTVVAEADGETTFEPGPVEVTATVQVVYSVS